MLRPLPAGKKGFEHDQTVIKLKGCPDCKGRGFFLINPFKTGGVNFVGGIGNMTQCPTCLSAHEYFQQHKELPADIAAAMKEVAE